MPSFLLYTFFMAPFQEYPRNTLDLYLSEAAAEWGQASPELRVMVRCRAVLSPTQRSPTAPSQKTRVGMRTVTGVHHSQGMASPGHGDGQIWGNSRRQVSKIRSSDVWCWAQAQLQRCSDRAQGHGPELKCRSWAEGIGPQHSISWFCLVAALTPGVGCTMSVELPLRIGSQTLREERGSCGTCRCTQSPENIFFITLLKSQFSYLLTVIELMWRNHSETFDFWYLKCFKYNFF